MKKIKNKKILYRGVYFLLLIYGFSFGILFSLPIVIQETPSAIYDGTDSRDTVAPQSADNSVTYEWNITWGLREFYDWGNGMVLDSSDNIYIVGTTENLENTNDMCLLKFDSSGVLQWNGTWGGDGIGHGSGVALDSSGNIYITGYSEFWTEMYLVKYDSEGVLQWNRTRSNAIVLQSNAIVLDSSDNIYLAGRLGGEVGLMKYDSEGVEQWTRSWGGSGEHYGNGIALDSFENIYVVGVTTVQPDNDCNMVLLKYDSSGGLQWSRTWGYSEPDFGESVAIDSFDNIYITGQTTNLVTLQYDIGLVKYSTSGVQLWDRVWGGSETDVALAITLDWYDDIFLAGETYNFGAVMNDMLLVKFDGSGMYQWNLTWGGSSEQGARAIALDSSQNVYLVGSTAYYDGFSYVADICLVKYKSDFTTTLPKIRIISPTPDEFFSNNAPDFQLSIFDASINTTWYTIDDGVTNITFSGLTGTIDQTEWDKKGDGDLNLRFYVNNTLGNSSYSEVTIKKDATQPLITIDSPLENELFGVSAPSFNLSIVEPNLDSVWYTLDNGVTNISTASLSDTIDLAEWIKFGNGTVTIRFYASDLAGHVGFSEVTVLKDIIAPIITINSPNLGDFYTNTAPSFSISIEEPNLNLIWYTLDGGVTTMSISSLTGVIDQIEWDKLGNGTVTIQFYANDTAGNGGISQITVYKDIAAPVIVINSPTSDEIFSSAAPAFDITVVDNQFDSMWYTIDGGLTLIPMVSTSGTVDQTEWDKNGGGNIYIRFYANDTLGNSGYLEVRIIKDVLYGIDPVDLLTPSTFSELYGNFLNFSWTSLDLGFGAVNFTLQISDAIDFSNIFFEVDNIAETLIFTNFSGQIPIVQGQNYWRVRPTYRNNVGAWSDYFSFILHINNFAPSMALIECTPTTGTRETIFRFTAIYYDLDDNPPLFINIIIDGITYSMEKASPSDTDYTDGCIYQYLTLLTPSTTAYTISFECSDGAFQYATSTYQGPLVEPDSTPSTNQGDNNLNSANTFAIIMTLGITIGVLIPFIVFTEKKVRKMKLGVGEKTSTKIKKKEIKS